MVNPQHAALYDSAMLARQRGDHKQAVKDLKTVLAQDKANAGALHLLAVVYLEAGQNESAYRCAKRATVINPDEPAFHNGLGLCLLAQQRFDDAMAAFDQAIALQPNMLEARINKANVHLGEGRYTDSLSVLDDVLEIDGNNLNALVNRATTLLRMGLFEGALEMSQKANALDPNSVDTTRSLLGLVNYSPYHGPDDVFKLTRHMWRLVEKQSPPSAVPHTHTKDQTMAEKAPLRVGYVSADFHQHVIGDLFEPVLTAHDKDAFEVFLYSNDTLEDELSSRLKNKCHQWRNIALVPDEKVAEQIRRDRIDILIDLGGITDSERLNVFKLKPAPIQMTWMGYVATTGVEQIDYIIADKHVLPEADTGFYVEQPLWMPHTYYCYDPPKRDLLDQTPTFEKYPGITFGCLNNVIKLNQRVIDLWASILRAVPESRLVIKYIQLSDDYVADAVKAMLQQADVDSDRLLLLGRTDRPTHLATYQSIDISLDPFPYGGGMSTFESLGMGIPVITRMGDTWASRASASILATTGLNELIASSDEDYVQKAVDLAQDPQRLEMMRKNLRVLFESSPACNVNAFVRELESRFRSVWESWCRDV